MEINIDDKTLSHTNGLGNYKQKFYILTNFKTMYKSKS
jgi:hypothetical protein